MQATGRFSRTGVTTDSVCPETIAERSDTFFRREVLYPLSYEGVPIQYKAPRTGESAQPVLHRPVCSPPEDTRTRQAEPLLTNQYE